VGKPCADPVHCDLLIVVAKVCSEASRQVIDSASSVYAVLCVAFVITYETSQGFYFHSFVRLGSYSNSHIKNGC